MGKLDRADRFGLLRRGDLRAGAVTLLTLVLLGTPIGLIWHAVAPHPAYSVAGGHATLLHPESKVFAADDFYLLFIGIVVGFGCGIVAWWLARRWGPGMVAGLAVGGVAGSFVAGAVGAVAGHAALPPLLAHHIASPILAPYLFGVHATGVLMAWPLVAVLTFGVATLLTRTPELREDLSWATATS